MHVPIPRPCHHLPLVALLCIAITCIDGEEGRRKARKAVSVLTDETGEPCNVGKWQPHSQAPYNFFVWGLGRG